MNNFEELLVPVNNYVTNASTPIEMKDLNLYPLLGFLVYVGRDFVAVPTNRHESFEKLVFWSTTNSDRFQTDKWSIYLGKNQRIQYFFDMCHCFFLEYYNVE